MVSNHLLVQGWSPYLPISKLSSNANQVSQVGKNKSMFMPIAKNQHIHIISKTSLNFGMLQKGLAWPLHTLTSLTCRLHFDKKGKVKSTLMISKTK